jgi:alkylhydroperoxidase family enzyme
MARVEGLKNENPGFLIKAIYWYARRRLGKVPERVKIAANAKKVFFGRAMFEILLDRSYLVDRRILRLAEIKAGMLIGCPAWLDAASAVGREEGITEEELKNLSKYRESDVFGSTEKLVLDLAVAMTKTPPVISDELFEQLQERFTTVQLVELATAIAKENLNGRFNRVFRCESAGLSEGAYCPMPELPVS